jgi:hypothetical protein
MPTDLHGRIFRHVQLPGAGDTTANLRHRSTKEDGYSWIQGTRPATIGAVRLPRRPGSMDREEVPGMGRLRRRRRVDFQQRRTPYQYRTLHWVTNTAETSAGRYYEAHHIDDQTYSKIILLGSS